MIIVNVKLYGTLRRFSQPETSGRWQGKVPEGTSVNDLISIIGSSVAEVAGATINGDFVPFEAVIPNRAEVGLVTPMGGG